MMKNDSILAACVTCGLFCGIAATTLADDTTPSQTNNRQTAKFDSIKASRIDGSGQLLRPTEASTARSQVLSPQADELNQIQPSKSFVRLAETARRANGNDRLVTQGNTSARNLNISWKMKVSRISALGDTKRQAGSFARSVTAEPEPAVGNNTLRQGPFVPRVID